MPQNKALQLTINPAVLTLPQRRRYGELAKKLCPLVAEFRELADGYAAELRAPRTLQSGIEELMKLETLCCPFFDLWMDCQNGGETERACILNITGAQDIKPFIRAEFGIP